MNKRVKKPFWQTNYWIVIVVVVVLSCWVMRQPVVWDFWSGLGYEPSTKVESVRDEIELTDKGKRIFAATRPEIEESESFNAHCESYDEEISLLGCYAEGRIYVYDITLDELVVAKNVTMAHELLHAVWERMGDWEKSDVERMLREVYEQNQEWFDEELEAYEESERLEEIYTRAGTKLENLPEDLEKHYAKVFRDRQKIVGYYQEYEAPFIALKLEIDELEEQIEQVSAEIEQGRRAYEEGGMSLDEEVDSFNRCAEIAGCFRSDAEFMGQRSRLLAEQERLEKMRGELNEKITANNQRVDEYREKQAALGRLGDAMNSNIEKEI